MSPNYWDIIHIASSESKLHFPIQFEVSKSLNQPNGLMVHFKKHHKTNFRHNLLVHENRISLQAKIVSKNHRTSPHSWKHNMVSKSGSKSFILSRFETSTRKTPNLFFFFLFQKFKTGSIWEKIHNSPNINPKIMKPVAF